jgi:peptidoglycan/xylan/chitin deacetylase (PgdA/CDA1 family)
MSDGGMNEEEEVRLRRMIAFGALGAAFVLFLLAIVLAFAGSGGDDGGGQSAAQSTSATATTPKRPRRSRPKPKPAGFPAVPANAPGAHKAPDEAVPILAYSVINSPKEDTANPQDWVPPEEFTAQMDYLQQQGFHPVTLRQVWAAWKENGLLPSKPVVISFDTGYHSVYANALPVLRDRKWTATLFLAPSQTQEDFPASEVKGLKQAGWELDLQADTQTDPSSIGDEELASQLTEGRRTVQRDYGSRVDFYSYGSPGFDQRVASAVQSAGFLGAVTLDEGVAKPDEPFQLPRIQLQNGDGEQGLADKLSSAGAG